MERFYEKQPEGLGFFLRQNNQIIYSFFLNILETTIKDKKQLNYANSFKN